MTKTNPLDLPEIRIRIAHHLNRKDLIQCILVCKAWHQTFLPPLWRNLFIDTSEANTKRWSHSPEIVERHRELIHHLSICINLPGLYTANYPKLQYLHLGPTRREYVLEGDPTRLITLNRSLTKINLFSLDGYLLKPFWKSISELSHLKTLELRNSGMVGEEAIEAFWTACMNLEDLSLSKVSFSAGFTIDTQVTFPKMKLLGLADIENMDNSMQLDIIRRCPRLEELTWYLEYPGQSMKLLGEYVGETLWPNLGGLSLGYRISDENLATIINSSRRITKLNLYRCHLEYPSFHALRRHFDTLVELSFRISPDVMGYMIIEVLCSCRHLKELKAKSILARDVVNGKPWVCTSLTYLQICFEFDKSEQNLQPLVFERLSHLVNLRTFGVGSWITWGSVSFQEALDLRLESGLGALANMKDIRHLNICDTTQSLSKDDVRWILANWRRLEIVSGKLSQVPFIHRELADMFRDRGIKA